MHERPQRPFIPHRTPKTSREELTRSEFLISPPFIPTEHETLAPIEEFLHTSNELEQLTSTDGFSEPGSTAYDEADEMPPVEHFMDPLPPVMAFAPDSADALSGDRYPDAYQPRPEADSASGETGWTQEGWQNFDWRSAASLGEGPEREGEGEASNEWATTDWEVSGPVARDRKPGAAEAIANALDDIARRIREGELSVPSPGALTDPVAIAASLAALLGVKR